METALVSGIWSGSMPGEDPFVTPYGYYVPDPEEYRVAVVDLWDEIVEWCRASVCAEDSLRFILGSVGSGRSTLGRCLAARLPRHANIRVVHISLSAFERIGEWRVAAKQWRSRSPHLREEHCLTEPRHGDFPLMFVFDDLPQGLDEQDLDKMIEDLDDANLGGNARIRFLLMGDVVMAPRLKSWTLGREAVFKLLPLRLERFDEVVVSSDPILVELSGDPDLVNADRRNDWWSSCVGGKLPKVLNNPSLVEMSASPGILASLARQFSDSREPSIPENVVAGLFRAVRRRGLHDPFEIAKGFALAYWQVGGLRRNWISLSSLRAHYGELPGLVGIDELDDWLKNNPMMRVANRNEEAAAATVRITGRALASYLVAEAIVDALDSIRGLHDPGYSMIDRWYSIFGGAKMEFEVFECLCSSLDRTWLGRSESFLLEAKKDLEQMFAEHLRRWAGLDLCNCPSGAAMNASETMLSTLNACARALQVRTVVKWPNSTAFRDWLSCLQGQRRDDSRVIRAFLCGLDFSKIDDGNEIEGCDLSCLDLAGANLSNCNLSNVDLHLTDLTDCNLSKPQIVEADLRGVRMNGARLTNATLRTASLDGLVLDGGINLVGLDADDGFWQRWQSEVSTL